jgi:predicted kinase
MPSVVDEAWLITGIPGAGKSTVAGMLARVFPRAAHVEGDLVGLQIVSGYVWPGQEPEDEAIRQMRLCQQNQCLLARSYAAAGFVPVMDYVVTSRSGIERYRKALAPLRLHMVVLDPGAAVALARDAARPEKTVAAAFTYLEVPMRQELRRLGLWVDSRAQTPEQTLAEILVNRERARL